MLIPIGQADAQELVRVTRQGGGTTGETIAACSFVPLVGEGGWPGVPRAFGVFRR